MGDVTERTTVVPGLTLDVAAPAVLPAPAVIVLHEWWGVNDDIRAICERLAVAGFFAIAPDLYHGEVTDDEGRALELAGALDSGAALRDLRQVQAHMAADPRVTSIGITGFCLGGGLALAAAAHVPGLAAAAPFYGIPLAKWLDPLSVRIPVQGHYGARDAVIPPEKPRAVFQALARAGVDVELCLYDAGHAFLRRGGENYDEAAATEAWNRMVAFFKRNLG